MKKNKKRKVSYKKIIFLLFVLVVIVCVGLLVINRNDNNNPGAAEVEVVDSIDNFDYQLNDNETAYYNELFSSLKELLINSEYNENEYAVLIGQLFLVDFYDLNSKVMKSDVGGSQFVYANYRSDFELGAMDNVYKFVESNVYGDRKQELPIVKKVEMISVDNNSYEYNDTVDNNAYYLTMSITYDKNLGYPSKVDLVLIHNGDKLEVAEMKTK